MRNWEQSSPAWLWDFPEEQIRNWKCFNIKWSSPLLGFVWDRSECWDRNALLVWHQSYDRPIIEVNDDDNGDDDDDYNEDDGDDVNIYDDNDYDDNRDADAVSGHDNDENPIIK